MAFPPRLVLEHLLRFVGVVVGGGGGVGGASYRDDDIYVMSRAMMRHSASFLFFLKMCVFVLSRE
jgi:hypothetical protein